MRNQILTSCVTEWRCLCGRFNKLHGRFNNSLGSFNIGDKTTDVTFPYFCYCFDYASMYLDSWSGMDGSWALSRLICSQIFRCHQESAYAKCEKCTVHLRCDVKLLKVAAVKYTHRYQFFQDSWTKIHVLSSCRDVVYIWTKQAGKDTTYRLICVLHDCGWNVNAMWVTRHT